MQRTMLAAVQATDERLIVPRYLMRISAHLAVSSSDQKDDSHGGQVRTGISLIPPDMKPSKWMMRSQLLMHYGKLCNKNLYCRRDLSSE